MTIKTSLTEAEFDAIDQLVRKIIDEYEQSSIYDYNDIWNTKYLSESATYLALKKRSLKDLKSLVLDLLVYVHSRWNKEEEAIIIVEDVLNENLNYTEAEWMQLVMQMQQTKNQLSQRSYWYLPIKQVMMQLMTFKKPTDKLTAFCTELLQSDEMDEVDEFIQVLSAVVKVPPKDNIYRFTPIQCLSDDAYDSVEKTLIAVHKDEKTFNDYGFTLKNSPTFMALKSQKPDELKPFIADLLLFVCAYYEKHAEIPDDHIVYQCRDILKGLLQKNLNYTADEWITLSQNIHYSLFNYSHYIDLQKASAFSKPDYGDVPMAGLIKQLKAYAKTNNPTVALKTAITEVLAWKGFTDAKKLQDLHTVLSMETDESVGDNVRGIEQETEQPPTVEVKTTLTEEAHKHINAPMNKISKALHKKNGLNHCEAYQQLKETVAVKPYLIDLLVYIGKVPNKYNYDKTDASLAVMSDLLRKNQHYNEAEWIQLVKQMQQAATRFESIRVQENLPFYGEFTLADFPITYVIKQLEFWLKKNSPSQTLQAFIKEILTWRGIRNNSKAKQKLNAMLTLNQQKTPETTVYFQLKDDTFGAAVNQAIKGSPIYQSQAFQNILFLANAVSGSKPTKSFAKEVEKNLNTVDKDAYRESAQAILKILADTSKQGLFSLYHAQTARQFFTGMVLTLDGFSDKKTVQLLGNILPKAYYKGNAMGLGNACAYILGNMRGKEGLGALSRARQSIKQASTQKTLDAYLAEGAKKYQVSPEELRDLSVPDFGWQNGESTHTLGDYQLHLSLLGNKVVQQWIKPDGKTLKSVPAAVKKDEKLNEKLKEIRRDIKEIQSVCVAQKQRFDNLFILEREWSFIDFHTYFLSHGLMASIVKRLIVIIKQGKTVATAMLYENQWQTAEGERLDWVDETCTLALWHPVHASETEIVAWRNFIHTHEIKQPIKQAFREIYLLTDAERSTATYSNRMASHIMRQHQFKTLSEMRDWDFIQHGPIDNGAGDASKIIEDHGITVGYRIDSVPDNSGQHLFYRFVATGQLSFFRENEPMQLSDVPPIVFSEIMRDADLFVAVCSIGNDPHWQDDTYWQEQSFGQLSEIAKTRKAILESLLPKLKIRDKSHIEGRFLVVRGEIRTYKIHIGSGNILMEPNDQYLCIVPERNSDVATAKLFVPFEGDNGLSIVLSKAFMLAEDTKIKDETIISQIKGE